MPTVLGAFDRLNLILNLFLIRKMETMKERDKYVRPEVISMVVEGSYDLLTGSTNTSATRQSYGGNHEEEEW